jgi:hypothetical protein
MKIDVEGHELATLTGSPRTLRLRPAIVCEVHGERTASEVKDLLEDKDMWDSGSFRIGSKRSTRRSASRVFSTLCSCLSSLRAKREVNAGSQRVNG